MAVNTAPFMKEQPTSDEIIEKQIITMLDGSTQQKPVHWNEIYKKFVEGGICANERLVAIMNGLLMPCGEYSGMNHNIFKGAPVSH